MALLTRAYVIDLAPLALLVDRDGRDTEPLGNFADGKQIVGAATHRAEGANGPFGSMQQGCSKIMDKTCYETHRLDSSPCEANDKGSARCD
jgi:hypothetical protein